MFLWQAQNKLRVAVPEKAIPVLCAHGLVLDDPRLKMDKSTLCDHPEIALYLGDMFKHPLRLLKRQFQHFTVSIAGIPRHKMQVFVSLPEATRQSYLIMGLGRIYMTLVIWKMSTMMMPGHPTTG